MGKILPIDFQVHTKVSAENTNAGGESRRRASIASAAARTYGVHTENWRKNPHNRCMNEVLHVGIQPKALYQSLNKNLAWTQISSIEEAIVLMAKRTQPALALICDHSDWERLKEEHPGISVHAQIVIVLQSPWAMGNDREVYLTGNLTDDMVGMLQGMALLASSNLAHANSRLALEILHDIASPLTVINANTSIVATECQRLGIDRTRLGESIMQLNKYVEQLTELVGELKRCGLGHRDKEIDLFELARDVSALNVATAMERKQVRVRVDGKEGVKVVGHPMQLRRVVENLVQNAIKANSQEVVLRVGLEGANAFVCVEDDGEGFDPQAAQQRMHTGMGLSLVTRFVQAHRGTMNIHRRKPRGSVFQVLIPASVAA